MKKHMLILFISITYCYLLYSQNQTITIMGKVIDNETSLCLSNAFISTFDKTIVTASNSSGDFEIHLPMKFKNDTLYISMLGYETFKEAVINIKNNHLFKLIPKVFSINEVNIKAYTAKEIVKKAFKNVNKNYHQQPALYDLYYREFIKKDSVYVQAIEVAANIYYKGFQHSFGGMQFKINNIRKSKSYYDGIQIDELSVINSDIGYIFRYFREYKYRLDSLTTFDGQLVYVISSVNDKHQKEWSKKYVYADDGKGNYIEIETSDSMLVENNSYIQTKYYITVDKFIIIKMCKTYADPREYVSAKYGQYNLSFEIVNNQAYISHFSKFFQNDYYKNKDLNQKDYTSYLFSEFYVNSIKTENVTEIQNNEQHSRHKDLYEQKFKYNPEFWKNYNYIIDDSLRKKVFEDIEMLDSLK